MHNVKRSEYKARLLDPAVSAKLSAKALHWNALSRELLSSRERLRREPSSPPHVSNGDADADAAADSPSTPSPEVLIALTEKMLTVNPDPAYLWNVRRELLLFPLPPPTEDKTTAEKEAEVVSTDSAVETSADVEISVEEESNVESDGGGSNGCDCRFNVESERSLTANCLRRNPKSYSAWYHRKWSLVRFVAQNRDNNEIDEGDSAESVLLRAELGLCADFLCADERNFHCWNYRRFAVSLIGRCLLTMDDETALDGSWAPFLEVLMDDSDGSGSGNNASLTKMMGAQLAPKIQTPSLRKRQASPLAPSSAALERLVADEWDFVTDKIRDNFSNGSAFHYRSKLMPLVLETRLAQQKGGHGENEDEGVDVDVRRRYDAVLELSVSEWESILLDSIFTEPDDQTLWWYHRFVVEWSKPPTSSPSQRGNYDVGVSLRREMAREYEALLADMADSLRELIEIEAEEGGNDEEENEEAAVRDESKGAKCKWAYLGLHLVLASWIESRGGGSNCSREDDDYDDDDDSPLLEELKMEADGCLRELTRIDPDRTGRYLSLASS